MSQPPTSQELATTSKNLKTLIDGQLEDAGGLLSPSPNWVPLSFLHPDASTMGTYEK